MSAEEPRDEEEEAPPLMGSWAGLYALVIGFLVAQVFLYWGLSVWAS